VMHYSKPKLLEDPRGDNCSGVDGGEEIGSWKDEPSQPQAIDTDVLFETCLSLVR
jgi:hypothetical protein